MGLRLRWRIGVRGDMACGIGDRAQAFGGETGRFAKRLTARFNPNRAIIQAV